MELIEQSHEIMEYPKNALEMIERVARTCYKSEGRITPESAPKFVERLIKRGHLAMIEFGDITVKFITNRGVAMELIRHRLLSVAMESTRYVRYKGDMEFIMPVWYNKASAKQKYVFEGSLRSAETTYASLLDSGWRPEQAREVLPNALKTEIVIKGNIREWRHIFTLRCAKASHPQMRALMIPLLEELKTKLPVVFDDL